MNVIKQIRKEKHISLEKLAELSGLSRSYLWLIESGKAKPSEESVRKLALALEIPESQVNNLLSSIRNEKEEDRVIHNSPIGANTGMQNSAVNTEIEIPKGLSTLYTDSIMLTTGQFGASLDFAQTIASTNKQAVVARIGMSYDHLKAFYDLIGRKLKERGLV